MVKVIDSNPCKWRLVAGKSRSFSKLFFVVRVDYSAPPIKSCYGFVENSGAV